MTNNGASIFSNNALIFVAGELVTQDTGTYDNSGTIEVTGDWTNNSVAPVVFINSSAGTVLLSGGAQNIQGTAVTNFHDLKLTGTGNKTQMIDATVGDSLVLNDRELATDTFNMHVTNTAPGCVTRVDSGIVSSLSTGGLARNMLSTSTYLFPVGSSAGTWRYRPAEVTPTSATAHTFKVRLANTDATLEGWDRSINDSTFCEVNPDYYHMISRTNGTSDADVTIWFDDALDNVYAQMAHWQTVPRWENMGIVTTVMNTSPLLSSVTSSGWGNYTFPSFILGTPAPPLLLSSSNTIICVSETVTFTATPGFTLYEFFINSISVQNSSLNTYIASGLASGSIIEVIATNPNCNGYSNKLTITVIPAPQAGPDYELCKNLIPFATYLDTVAATPSGGTWSSPDPLVSPNLNPDGSINHLAIPWGNGYQIVYTFGGCTDTMLLDVTGALAGADTTACPTGAFFLSAAQPPGGTWSYLDPTTGIQTTTNIIDPLTGEIDKGDLAGPITFIYTSQGCPDTMVVTLCGENDIWVPNIFSPNGDGSNDIVFVRGEAVDYVTIVIYDRWGELIFDGNSTEVAMNTGWDGTKRGKELAPQVFVYFMKGAFLDGEEFEKQGNITLVK